VYFRRGKGQRIALPSSVGSDEFNAAYQAALGGQLEAGVERRRSVQPGTIAALIVSYMSSESYLGLRPTTKVGYATRIEALRIKHGHRTMAGLTRERIITGILQPYAGKPGAALSTLKMLRILINHAITIGWLKQDPSVGIERPKIREVRSWTDDELARYEARWPIGTKQRAAYAIMLYVGTARADAHLITWAQFDRETVVYVRRKTGVPVDIGIDKELQEALNAIPRDHVTILNTEYGRPFTVNGFSSFMRNAIRAAGLPLDCKPHGLRKTLGRMLADAGCTAHEVMAALGHTTLAEAERYTREADRRRGARQAVIKLGVHRENRIAQTPVRGLGKKPKTGEKSK
jgi:integrase